MLKDIQSTGKKDTRSGFGDGIVEAARKNPNVVALTADLAGSLKLNQFMKEFPDRFVQCGIAEEMSRVLDTSEGALKASYHHAVKKIEDYILNH